MKAVRVYKDGIIKLEDISNPSIDSNAVKIKVKACGICGSDYPRMFDNKAHYYPITLGHEFSGIIVEIGENVKKFEIGDHVVGVPLIPCHKCIDCKNGDYALCKNYNFIGSRVDGAMAEYIVVPKENVIKIDKNVDFITGALVEPMTVALHGIKISEFKSDYSVAILGLGTIGCFVLQLVKLLGARNVIVFVRNKKYYELAKKLGADFVINTSDDDWQINFEKITNGRGVKYVYETAGSDETIRLSYKIVGNKGNICLIGTPKKEVCFDVDLWEMINRKELCVKGSWMSYSKEFPGYEWNEIINYVNNNQLTLDDRMNTKIYILDKGTLDRDDIYNKDKRMILVWDRK